MYAMLNNVLLSQALVDASQGTLGDVCLPAHLPSSLPAVPKVSSCALRKLLLCCRVFFRPGVSAVHLMCSLQLMNCNEHLPAKAQFHKRLGLLLPTLSRH